MESSEPVLSYEEGMAEPSSDDVPEPSYDDMPEPSYDDTPAEEFQAEVPSSAFSYPGTTKKVSKMSKQAKKKSSFIDFSRL